MQRIEITNDLISRASKGLLTDNERRKMREEMLWYRQHLMTPRKILFDLLLENTNVKIENLL